MDFSVRAVAVLRRIDAGFDQSGLDLIDRLLIEIGGSGYLLCSPRCYQLSLVLNGYHELEFARGPGLTSQCKPCEIVLDVVEFRVGRPICVQARKSFRCNCREAFLCDVPANHLRRMSRPFLSHSLSGIEPLIDSPKCFDVYRFS